MKLSNKFIWNFNKYTNITRGFLIAGCAFAMIYYAKNGMTDKAIEWSAPLLLMASFRGLK